MSRVSWLVVVVYESPAGSGRVFGETREQTQLLWIKIWEQPAVAVGRMFSSRLAGRASCFGTRASTILGGLKIRKSKKIHAGHQAFLWKTPQPLLLTCGQSHHPFGCLSCLFELSPVMPLGCFARGIAAPTSLMGIDVIKMVALRQRIYISSHSPVSDRSSGPDMG